jgi:hypothetical protein
MRLEWISSPFSKNKVFRNKAPKKYEHKKEQVPFFFMEN